MKKTIAALLIASSLLPAVSMAHEHHGGGHGMGWFLGGVLLGGLVAHEMDNNTIVYQSPPGTGYQRITVCSDVIVTDVYGISRLIKQCHFEYVPIN